MKITNNIIQETVIKTVGEDVIPVVDYLKSRKNISEFKIAEKVGLEVNQTRNMLYRLHTHNLVFYNKKKDKQKGWYISYWTFNTKRVKDLLKAHYINRLERLQVRLAREESYRGDFYICPKLCNRCTVDEAMEKSYTCPECSSIMKQQDNSKTIDNIKAQIDEIKDWMKKKRV